MDTIAHEAMLRGEPGCRCRDARAAVMADIAGTAGPGATCPVHSQHGRDETEEQSGTAIIALPQRPPSNNGPDLPKVA